MAFWKAALEVLGTKKQNEFATLPGAELSIKLLEADDIGGIVHTFSKWGKKAALFERYLDEQQRGERIVLVATLGPRVVGYTTLIWHSPRNEFQQQNIPEIMDLNVITNVQGRGIGSSLIRACEKAAAERSYPIIGICPGQTTQYARAQKLYPALGYSTIGYGFDEPEHLPIAHMTKPLQ